jgi:hypothetical protein
VGVHDPLQQRRPGPGAADNKNQGLHGHNLIRSSKLDLPILVERINFLAAPPIDFVFHAISLKTPTLPVDPFLNVYGASSCEEGL